MRNLLFALVLFTSYISSAQDSTIFAPLGATWYYRPWTPGPDTGLYTFTSANDTLLDGWNARVLRCSVWVGGAMYPAESLNKYVATVGNKVFYRVAGEFVLLFDFDAQPGDTVASKVEDFAIFNGCVNPQGDVLDFRYRIDSVGAITIDGINLRVQFVTTIKEGSDIGWYIGGYNSPIIERIGAERAGYWWGHGDACILAGFPGYLRCYEDNDLHFQSPPVWGSGGACDYVSTSEPVFESLKITPNPASAMAQLPFFPDHVDVFNLLGQKVNAPVFGEMLDVSLLVSGIYRIIAEKDGRFYVGQLAVCSSNGQ